ncbi:lysoplasmalogenase [Leptospira gomenensis]|uniref:Lysoplasmalogenase n=1 Tax=Leptospira gomenensis TaxID=2484974 RepID=A0A5F1YAF8_9LEPT|nr:lysoplasmalogenase [Leptospira gomenensis]TGK33842.1 lysoplasmalogenase [Leptospira gomenensis]TGK36296.1 lysoplasmalogenase [Leptospira gomenensis]TGK52067.1 lysoplasmalogenase [Leptospira gomenensis]TGK59884.1 lysoplasmalogenase [Leptospira gomenensis]
MVLLLFSVSAIAHLLTLYFAPGEIALKLGTKLVPILILIFFSFFEGDWKDKTGKFILIGLVFSLFGDTFLALPGNYFVFGLGSFLVAQIFYSIGFSAGNPVHILRSIPYFVFGASFYFWILPGLGNSLLIPVAVYVTAICTMGWRAASRESSRASYWKAFAGALIFIASDSLIATGKFTSVAVPWNGLWIMITYYAAQFLIYDSVEET